MERLELFSVNIMHFILPSVVEIKINDYILAKINCRNSDRTRNMCIVVSLVETMSTINLV